ncbi:MAG TPA: hydroxymethylbilane synthase [Pyrinomonadaceae bacterium]
MTKPLVIGSRGSKLALWQAEHIQQQLLKINPSQPVTIEIIKTTGDVKRDPLSIIGGQGVFTKELEDALLAGRIDIAVHSLKDLPTVLPEQLTIAAICEREDPRDALVLRTPTAISSLLDLKENSIVGTSSQRRFAQLKAKRPDIQFKEIRGNVDTRLRKLDDGNYDALILASAGLIRLGLRERIALHISIEEMLPAVGQGAIGIETRADNEVAVEAVRKLQHEPTRIACLAERSLLRQLGGGCQFPIAAHGMVQDNELQLEALVAKPDGSRVLRGSLAGNSNEPEELGAALAGKLNQQGAQELLNEAQ